ncbi:MAG: hypothetical protein SGJ20_19105 [Planctomycetota bacterium]|nr:hypothetical protein [Planctomycetota bacterium]
MSTSDTGQIDIRLNGHAATDNGAKSEPLSIKADSIWHASAPASVLDAFTEGDRDAVWRAWQKHLRRRSSPRPLAKLFGTSPHSYLSWGMDRTKWAPDWKEQLKTLFSSDLTQQCIAAEALLHSAAPLDRVDPSPQAALGWLACGQALPRLSRNPSSQPWWETLDFLTEAAHFSQSRTVLESPLVSQLLGGELSLSLSLLFPELTSCRELSRIGQKTLQDGFEELLDGKGMVHARYLSHYSPLVACWTRCSLLSASHEDLGWSKLLAAHYPQVVRHWLAWMREDASLPFESAKIERRPGRLDQQFLAAAVAQADDRRADQLLAVRLKAKSGKSSDEAAKLLSKKGPGFHSEWSELALLQSNWGKNPARLAVTYHDRTMRGELTLGRQRLICGDWNFTATVNGQQIQNSDDWTEVCWVRDEDVVYLELQLDLSANLKLQRQMCLARKDRFLMVADALIGKEPHGLEYEVRLPLDTGITARPAEETREISLWDEEQPVAVVLPLALPEWKSDTRGGSLSVIGDELVLRQSQTGSSLFAPLWIDLAPQPRHVVTWRQLTVAEERVNVSRDSAVGYRVRLNKSQWLMYRALAKISNRTVLGHNLAGDFTVARFPKSGVAEPLLEIE